MSNRLLARLGIGSLGASSISMALGFVARGLILAGYLVLTSRWLGVDGYGEFSGVVATVMIFATLSGWGVNQVLVQKVAPEPAGLARYWSTALLQTLLVGAALLALLPLLAAILTRGEIAWSAFALIGISELIALPVALGAVSALLAVGRPHAAAIALCIVPGARLLAVAVGMLSGMEASIEAIAELHLAGSLAGAVVAMLAVRAASGPLSWSRRAPMAEVLPVGTPYVAGNVVGNSYLEIDKVMILSILGSTVLGPYTVAFRAASLFALPVTALMSAALPRLFAAPTHVERQRTLRAVVVAAALYGLLASILVALSSPFLPLLFGEEFAAASGYLLLLSPWPLLFAVHQALACGLTGSGLQGKRVLIEGAGLLLLLGANLALLGRYGASAAILSLLLVEGAIALGCLFALARRAREGATPESVADVERHP